jgi:parallel beta-helix repeat protein
MRIIAVLPIVVLAACGSDSAAPADAAPAIDANPADPNGCTMHLKPGADSATTQSAVQTALAGAGPGSVLCFDEGTYNFSDELSVTGASITLKGLGAVWDFSHQTIGENGLHATQVSDFVVEGLVLQNAAMNNVRIDNGTHVTMRDLTVTWTGGPATTNGAYALYPVGCDGVLIEHCDVSNSSDAAIYVGQSQHVVVRDNIVHSAAAGIEIENTSFAEVYGNWAFDNVEGILVFALPDLPVKTADSILVHDNSIESNNLRTFASAGNVVALVPSGAGMLVMAATHVEIRNNTFESNEGTGIIVNSCDTLSMLAAGLISCTDTGFNGFPGDVDIHDNLFYMNGLNPVAPLNLFEPTQHPPLQDILWDGVAANATDMPSQYLCVMNNGAATYLDGDAADIFGSSWMPSTDPTPVGCSLPAVAGVDVSWTRP